MQKIEVLIGSEDISKYVRSITFEGAPEGIFAWGGTGTKIFFWARHQRLNFLERLGAFGSVHPSVFIRDGAEKKLYKAANIARVEHHLEITTHISFNLSSFNHIPDDIIGNWINGAMRRGAQDRELYLRRPDNRAEIRWEGGIDFGRRDIALEIELNRLHRGHFGVFNADGEEVDADAED